MAGSARRAAAAAVLALTLLPLRPAPAAAARKALPPPPASRVYDEGVLGAGAPALGARLEEVERRTGHQLVVAAFRSLDGESLEDYTNRLFRSWKPGSAKGNDGVLFALFAQDRRWRVEVGYGLEPVLTDLEAAEVARAGVPYFQRGEYAGGVFAVVDGLAARIARAPGVRLPRPRRPLSVLVPSIRLAVILLLLLLRLARLGFLPSPYPTISGRGVKKRRSAGWGSGGWSGGGWGGGGFGGGGFGGGGFSGGGGSSGGGGASGGW